jgi:iron complex transport system permease protein
MSPAEVPIGVVTAFLGAPFFIVLLRTRKVVT